MLLYLTYLNKPLKNLSTWLTTLSPILLKESVDNGLCALQVLTQRLLDLCMISGLMVRQMRYRYQDVSLLKMLSIYLTMRFNEEVNHDGRQKECLARYMHYSHRPTPQLTMMNECEDDLWLKG
jgi:hypothetical protein